ncbi:MAG: hypothetical protein IT536_13895 [Hyphomicrobiales bacterium]|nr:hypothetical protein [Hyphomicrobiales bacterium]
MTDGMDRDDARAEAAPELDAIIAQALAEQSARRAASQPPLPRLRGDASLVEETHRFAATARARGSIEAAESAPSPAFEPAPPVQPIEAPSRWSGEDQARFATWPREVQETVLASYKAIEADDTRKTQEAAELRQSAEPILNAVKPFEAYLRRIAPVIGQSPGEMIANLLGVEYRLRTGDPAQKAHALAQIAASYGIDLAAFSRGDVATDGAAAPSAPAADPHYQQLRHSFGNLEQQFAQFTQWMESEQKRQAAAELEAFVTATDPAGRPRHPHFERVRGVMSQLLRDDPAMTLAAAYQAAVAPIKQAIAEELNRRNDQAEQQRQAALEKARKAAPVWSSGSPPHGSARPKDLDSILSDAINARLS